MALTRPDPSMLDQWAEDYVPYSIRLVSEQSRDVWAQARRDRRAYERHSDRELQWVRIARLGGHSVSLVDLSSGGALLDSPVPLRPASVLTLEIVGAGFDAVIPFRVLRCEVGSLTTSGTVYRGACEFTELIDLPDIQTVGKLARGGFVGLDFALKYLVERAGPSGDIRSHDTDLVRQALHALRGRALRLPLDPIGSPLAALLDRVVPALEHYQGLASVLGEIESELRRTVPQASLRLTGSEAPASAGVKSTLINVPGAAASSSLVRIDIPRGVVLNAWQSRILRVTTRLIALLQRLEPERVVEPAIALVRPVSPEEVSSPALPDTQDFPETTNWQKVVVRYAEGQMLKGYTQDFSSARSQFSLWPSIAAAAAERVIVPLARLKGVFFVRDFAGNPGYVERTDGTHAQHGRPIEVTLVDDEVIVGRTLSYRPDGYGFFVVPNDPLANNIRVFIVSSAVRQVRFPNP